jgi:hypothetical protein
MNWLVRNQSDQPLELHFASRTLVLAAYGEAEVDAAEAQSPQLHDLQHRHILSLHAPPQQEGEAATAEPAEHKRKAPPGRTRKGAGR